MTTASTDTTDPPSGTDPRLLTAAAAGERLMVSAHTIRRWAREGRLGFVLIGPAGRTLRFTPAHLAAFIAANERPADD